MINKKAYETKKSWVYPEGEGVYTPLVWRWIIITFDPHPTTYVDGGNYTTRAQAQTGLAEALRALEGSK